MHLLIAIVAAGICLCLTPSVIRFAERRGLYDIPSGGRRIHTDRVPRLGGLAIFLSTLVAVAVWVILRDGALHIMGEPLLLGVLIGGSGIAAVGLVDDLVGIRARTKLLAQIGAGIVLYMVGISIDGFALNGVFGFKLGLLALPATILWVVLVTNAINLIDGLDGLASGISIIALASLAAVAASIGNNAVIAVATPLLGALLAFLRYNFRPARIFLGDSGSLFIGFVLAALSISIASSAPTAMLGLAPIFALVVPLADTGLSFMRRWLRGKSWSDADKRHIHHMLVARGIPHLRAVLMLWLVASAVAAIGLMAAFAPPSFLTLASLGAGLVTIALLVWGLGYLDYHEFPQAVRVLMQGPGRLRAVIREQIHAEDIARAISVATSLRDMNAVLSDAAPDFGFIDMRVGREGDVHGRMAIHPSVELGVRASVLEHPLNGAAFGEDPFVLRIWCRPDELRPYGRERVVAALAPAIGRRLGSFALPNSAVPEPTFSPVHSSPSESRKSRPHQGAPGFGHSVLLADDIT